MLISFSFTSSGSLFSLGAIGSLHSQVELLSLINVGKGNRKKLVFRETIPQPCYFLHFYVGNLAAFILGQRHKEIFRHEGIILALFHSTGYKDAVSDAWEHSSQCSDIFLDFSGWVPSHGAHLSHIEDCCFLIPLLQGILQEALPPLLPSQQKQKGQKLPSREMCIDFSVLTRAWGLTFNKSSSSPQLSLLSWALQKPVCLISINHHLLVQDTFPQCKFDGMLIRTGTAAP